MKYRVLIDMVIEADSKEEAIDKFSEAVCTGETFDNMKIEEEAEKETTCHDAYVDAEIENYKEWFRRFTT